MCETNEGKSPDHSKPFNFVLLLSVLFLLTNHNISISALLLHLAILNKEQKTLYE